MREEDAKEMLCPILLATANMRPMLFNANLPMNTNVTIESPHAKCIGERCMMWRYEGATKNGHCGMGGQE